MRDFTTPFKPEELLAQPADGRLWAEDIPSVEDWTAEEVNGHLDALVGRLLASHGHDIAEGESFSLVFALIQAWPRLDEGVRPRVADLVADAARRCIAEVMRMKQNQKSAPTKKKEEAKQQTMVREARTAAKVAAFFLRWTLEKLLRQEREDAVGSRGRGRGKGGGRGAKKNGADDQAASAEELKELQRASEKQRCSILSELVDLVVKDAMPWLWMSDDAGWQQVAQSASDAGFVVLDNELALKHRETRQLALRNIADPLRQDGHQHSNLLVATVSKLTHGLRGHELAAAFAADTLLMAHTTPLPRLFLVELTQHCTPAELTSQGGFQRALGAFLVAIAERLPHVVLANISVLLPLLDVDCYPLRSAIVESIGHLLSAEGKPLPRGARSTVAGNDETQAAADVAVQNGTDPSADGAVVAGDALVVADGGATSERTGRFCLASATKKDLLETLAVRATDKTVWVRVRALTTLNNLASNRRIAALPREQWTRVLEIATRRMQDVASSARKAAIQLVRTLIELHPYGPAIRGVGDERAKAEQVLREVAARMKTLREEELRAEAKAAGIDVDVEVDDGQEEGEGQPIDDEPQAKRRRCKSKTVTEKTVVSEVDKCLEDGVDDTGSAAERRQAKVEALKRMHDCYTQRMHFVELINAAETRLRALLVSRTASDVTESINVVVELRLRGLPAANQAFNQVLGLVWSRHSAVKDAAVDAFYRMNLEGRDSKSAVSNLLEMYRDGCDGDWTYTHLASVQELIQEVASRELINPKVAIPALVDATREPSTCPMAIRALTALAASSWTGLAAQLPRLVEFVGSTAAPSAGATASDRLGRVRLICQLLQRLHACCTAMFSEEHWKHLEELTEHATTVVVEHFARGEVPPEWFGAAQAAMDLTFDLHSSATATSSLLLRCPDKLWEQILSRMLQSVMGQKGQQAIADGAPGADTLGAIVAVPEEGVVNVTKVDGDFDEEFPKAETANGPKVTVNQVGCVVFLAGHLALRMLIFLEGLQSALKKKRLAEEDARMAEQREKKKEKEKEKEKQQQKKAKRGNKGPKEEEEDEGAEASSMGMAGQEEREAEFFAEIAEQRLLYGAKSLFDRVKPLIFGGLLDKTLREEPILRRSSAISLCKFMTVSKRFCEENLQLLFSVLFPKTGASALGSAETASHLPAGRAGALFEDLTLRQSLLVSVGDLLFRHPNVVEPWSERLYTALAGSHDEESGGDVAAMELRLTALLVLTHLVLNDMMKPRAVLLVRALWLTACPHEATARVARILFQELSKRTTNVVYNLLPEIIARLPEFSLGSDSAAGAEARVRYVMQFIEKEKHVEGLIEKFTVRLEQSADVAGGKASAKAEGKVEIKTETKAETKIETETETKLEADAEEAGEGAAPPSLALETANCLATALGSMTYTDRCILRLHDAVVMRKALNNAIAYHQVTRDNLLAIVERARKPRVGREKNAEAAAPADGDAAGASEGGGKGAAVTAALEGIESTVAKLGQGQDGKAAETSATDADNPAPADAGTAEAAAPAAPPKVGKGGRGAGRGAKREVETPAETVPAVNADMGDEAKLADIGKQKAKPAGRGRGRSRGVEAPAAESAASGNATAQGAKAAASRGGAPAKGGFAAEIKAAQDKLRGAKKRRTTSRTKADDDEDEA